MPHVNILGVGVAKFPDDMPINDIKEFLKGKFSNPQAVIDDARFGELGKINNPDGSISTEFSITENIPELGGFVNIPTLVRGQKDIETLLKTGKLTNEQFSIAISRAIERVKSGAKLPAFKSLDEAIKAAEGRTIEEKLIPFQNRATTQ